MPKNDLHDLKRLLAKQERIHRPSKPSPKPYAKLLALAALLDEPEPPKERNKFTYLDSRPIAKRKQRKENDARKPAKPILKTSYLARFPGPRPKTNKAPLCITGIPPLLEPKPVVLRDSEERKRAMPRPLGHSLKQAEEFQQRLDAISAQADADRAKQRRDAEQQSIIRILTDW